MSYTDKEKNREYAASWYARNRERLLADPVRQERQRLQAMEWRRANRIRNMLSQAKARAKRLGYEFDLELTDIEVPDICPILLIPLEFSDGAATENTPALDRMDNSKGYIKGNARVISHKANKHKADLSIEDIARLAAYVTRP